MGLALVPTDGCANCLGLLMDGERKRATGLPGLGCRVNNTQEKKLYRTVCSVVNILLLQK